MKRICADVTLQNIDDWFAVGKPITAVETVGQSSQQTRAKAQTDKASLPKPFIPPYRRHARTNNPRQMEYADHYKQVEEQTILQNQPSVLGAMGGAPALRSQMEELEIDSVTSGMASVSLPDGMTLEEATEIYNNYDFNHSYSDKLSITKFKEEIIGTIENNQVTVIQGPTGSGKTTQVPQYILDHYAQQKKYCNIIVTQPRRIAAMSIARRVCQERGWQMSGICGYQIAMDRQVSEDTRLLYCTTGVLLQKLINTKDMTQYTHVVLDEVHERDQESDFCLLIARKLLRTNSRDVKVVLMSATFDTAKFAEYFSIPVRNKMEPAPVISVEGRTFKVSGYYIEDLQPLGQLPLLMNDDPCIPPESYELAKRLIMEFDKLEIKESGETESGFAAKRGSVLVFLPGLGEIDEMKDLLDLIIDSHSLWILPLHSSITGEEQVRVFNTPDYPKRKVILSTNIAESSITVPDIKYVIDFCLTRNLMCDQNTNYTSLQVAWASLANCDQRKGRAGRVSNGRVYRMVTRKFFEDKIPDFGVPEMQRCPLDQLVLQSKMLDMGEPTAILGLALSPPYLDDIERTVLNLKQVGALTSLEGGAVNPHDGKLTFMGRVLAGLPVDIRLGKLMLLGHTFGLLDECIIIAASLSQKSFFAKPHQRNYESYQARLGWSSGDYSDCLAYLKAYQVWEKKTSMGELVRTHRHEKEWGKEYFIQIRRIKETKHLVTELKDRLARYNIRSPRHPNISRNPTEEKFILKILMCGAFYPNYFNKGPKEEKQIVRFISGKNPFTTVMVKGLPPNQGSLYRSRIAELFKCCHPNVKVHVEETRAYVEFPKDVNEATNQFCQPVYAALKMRQLRIPLFIHLLDADEAFEKMREMSEMRDDISSHTKRLKSNRIKAVSDGVPEGEFIPHQVELPGPTQTIINIHITDTKRCGHFWAHYGDEQTWNSMMRLHHRIQQVQNLRALTRFNVGTHCLAYYEDSSGMEIYRARVENYKPPKVTVFYVDYGNTAVIDTTSTHQISQLYQMEPDMLELPFQAMEFELVNIQPSPVTCPEGVWNLKAKREFQKLIDNKQLYAQIYSIVHGVVRVDLYDERKLHINKVLLDNFVADYAQEGYSSEQNHLLREEILLRPEKHPLGAHQNWTETKINTPTLEPLVRAADNRRRAMKIQLQGPDSPYEIKFFNMTNAGRFREARVDRDSVNCVALDEAVQDQHARLMVAAFVGLNPSGSTVLARDTTLMPNLHGLAALMCLLWCPNAELRTDPKRTYYTGAICGLGWDPETGGAALPDHDMEVTFDTVIDNEDLEAINLVRMTINIAIGGDETEAQWGPDAVLSLQQRARSRLLKLLRRRRESIEPKHFERAHRWNQVCEDDLLRPELTKGHGDSVYKGQLLNLHCAIVLREAEEQQRAEDRTKKNQEAKLTHISWLHSKANKESTLKEDLPCDLCRVVLRTPRELALHLATRRHRELETNVILKRVTLGDGYSK